MSKQQKKNACGKPETPQTWVGVTNPYKKGINIIKYYLYNITYILPIYIHYIKFPIRIRDFPSDFGRSL